VRKDLHVVRESAAGPESWNNVLIFLDAEPAQRASADGLVATIGVENHGKTPVSMLNPFATVQFQLHDERGFPLRIPTKPSSLRSREFDDWKLEPPFPIVRTLKNGAVVAPETLNERTLRLAPGDAWQVAFQIDRLIPEAAVAGSANGPFSEVPLPDGTYRLRSVATLIRADEPQDSRILQSPLIEVDFVRRH
jgi:hypothetical protein